MNQAKLLLKRTMWITGAVFLTGCSITTLEPAYRTVWLPESFTSASTLLEVESPSKPRSEYLNKSIGSYMFLNSQVSEQSYERAKKPEQTVTEERDRLIPLPLDYDSVTVNKYRYITGRKFNFNMTHPDELTTGVVCVASTTGLKNEEIGRLSIGLGIGEISPVGEMTGSSLKCSISDADKRGSWSVSWDWDSSTGKKFEIESGNERYTIKELQESSSPKRGVSGEVAGAQDVFYDPDSTAGVGIYLDSTLVAATSLAWGNNMIWLGERIPPTDRPFITPSLYAFLAYKWTSGWDTISG